MALAKLNKQQSGDPMSDKSKPAHYQISWGKATSDIQATMLKDAETEAWGIHAATSVRDTLKENRRLADNYGIGPDAPPKQALINVDASLEAMVERAVQDGMDEVHEKRESDVSKDICDIAAKTAIHVALRLCRMESKINPSIQIWDVQLAANVLGLKHGALNRKIKAMIEEGELTEIEETNQVSMFVS